MQATTPYVEVPGDNKEGYDHHDVHVRERIMGRAGSCVAMSHTLAVWRFGFSRNSESAMAYGVYTEIDGFLWVLATRRTGKIKEQWTGYAINLPPKYRKVIEWEPTA